MAFSRDSDDKHLYAIAPGGALHTNHPHHPHHPLTAVAWPLLTPRRVPAPGAGAAAALSAPDTAPLEPINWLRWSGSVILGFIVVLVLMAALVALQDGRMTGGPGPGVGPAAGGTGGADQ